MYLNSTITDKAEMNDGFFKPTFSPEAVQEADRMEVWSSSFKDDGGDFNVFKLMSGDNILEEQSISGY